MTFSYPQTPSEWQTAYTRDQAHRESGSHARHASFALLIGSLIVAGFIAILSAPIIDQLLSNQIPKTVHPVITDISLFVVCFLLWYLLITFLYRFVQKGALRFAVNFFKEFHQPPEGLDPAEIILYRLYGKAKLPPPFNLMSQFEYIIARDGKIVKEEKWPAWSAQHLGGPILLIVFDGCALYLERGNRFSRIVGPGDKIPFLEWYETIKYVVDLRPKVQQGEFDVWTKDGINIKLIIQIECRIGDPKYRPPAANLTYPYDPIAIKKAIERHAVRWPTCPEGEPSEFTWIDAAWGQVMGIVPGYIGSRMLDDLFMANRESGQILSPYAVKEIFDNLNNATQTFGVYMTDFQILEIKIPKEVEEHQKEFWKAERQSIAALLEGEAKASGIRAREEARADAQRDLILAIADGLEKNPNQQYTEPLLLSLSGILDNSLTDPLIRACLAGETLDTLEKLQKLLDKSASSSKQ